MANYSKTRTYSRAKKPKVEEKKTLLSKAVSWVKKLIK